MNSKNSGFTLIELLVVIAIIGILSSVVLVSLGSAREKAKDIRIVSTVQQIRTMIEKDSNGVDYGNSFYPAAFTALFDGNVNAFRAPGNSSNDWSILIQDALASSKNSFRATSTIVADPSGGYGSTATGGNAAAIYIITNGVMTTTAGQWGSNPTKYAIWGRLSTGQFFCIDSTGNTKNPSTVVTSDTAFTNTSSYYSCQ